MKNHRREELLREFGATLDRLRAQRRPVLWVAGIKIVNAVVFAVLWQAGFPRGWPLLVWLVFFALSMAFAFEIDRRLPQSQARE